ncbi:MAG: Transcriptional regulator PadR-like family protein [Lentisphaerae bacterium ADurb.BinA184]|nr:MAG: Transcriptional regulator PadR-like family protein [Lentisphaerae bacterium ADurb.BinA184]
MSERVNGPCTGATLNKLVQPAILTTLAREPLYGYRIAEELERMPVVKGGKLDTTGLYRTLKTMERRGLVAGEWKPSEIGPDRRLYRLTRTGGDCLARWVETLDEYCAAVGALLASARTACRSRPWRRSGASGRNHHGCIRTP